MFRRVDYSALARIALFVAVAGGLGACASGPYVDRRDSVTPQFGDAIATNKAAQTIDPWPADVGNRRITVSGDHVQQTMARYRSGQPILPPVPQANALPPVTTGSIGPMAHEPKLTLESLLAQ